MNEKIEEYLKLPISEIEKKIEANDEILGELWKNSRSFSSWDDYAKECNPYWEDNYCLWTAKIMLTPQEEIVKQLKPMSDLDVQCRVPIEKFEAWCGTGCVTWDDGDGVYATENETTDLDANPRAFHEGYIRKDFKYVCWYNK
jgi:hypothetical protein